MKAFRKTYYFLRKQFNCQWSCFQFSKDNSVSNPAAKPKPIEKEQTDVYYYEEENYSLLSSQQDIREKKMNYFIKKIPDFFQNLLWTLLFLYSLLKIAELADTMHNQNNLSNFFKDLFDNHNQFHTVLYLAQSIVSVAFVLGYFYALWQFLNVFEIFYLKKYTALSLVLFVGSVVLEYSYYFNEKLKSILQQIAIVNPSYLQHLALINVMATFVFNLLNLMIINLADKEQNVPNSIQNSIFFKLKVLVFIIMSTFTILYSITYLLLLNIKIKPTNYQSMHNSGDIYQFPLKQIIESMKVTHINYKQLYIYDIYQISIDVLAILFPFYQTLYIFEATYLRTKVNHQLNDDYFIDRKQSNIDENHKQANIL